MQLIRRHFSGGARGTDFEISLNGTNPVDLKWDQCFHVVLLHSKSDGINASRGICHHRIVLNLSRYNCTVFPVIFWICLNHQVDLVIEITQEHVEK